MAYDLMAIAVGGALGALLRFGIALWTRSWIIFDNGFPLGTFIANMLGALLMGILFQTFERFAMPVPLKLLLTTGFLGALTTFSTFALESVILLRDGLISTAIIYLLLSNCIGLLLVWTGMQLVQV